MNRPSGREPVGQARPDRRRPTCRRVRAVVGFDGSPASFDALAYAVGWSRRVVGEVDVLHVADPDLPQVIDVGGVVCPLPSRTDPPNELPEFVAEVLRDSGSPWTYAVGRGDVAQALEDHAARLHADVIIIGRPRRAHWLRSSIGRRLLQATQRIVIIVP
jgi:nucleotide-binding universal stress UspA family protein